METTYIIAEAGVNHNGSLATAKRLVDAAARAGADAVKFQTFLAEKLAAHGVPRAAYQKQNMRGRVNQFQMLKRLELPYDCHFPLKKYCAARKIEFLSSAFDEESLGFLVHELGIKKIKVPSGEITNLPFLKIIAARRKPVILSTGMSTLDEVRRAVRVLLAHLPRRQITVLHCTSNYPCPYGDVNLRAMLTLRKALKLNVGYSDHTPGIEVAVAAVALGAKVIEKHLTLDKAMPGPDHRASLEPDEFGRMVTAIRNVELAMGNSRKKPTPAERLIRDVVRKRLVYARPLAKGALVNRKDVIAKRAKGGITPGQIDRLIGMELKTAKKADDPILWKDLAKQ